MRVRRAALALATVLIVAGCTRAPGNREVAGRWEGAVTVDGRHSTVILALVNKGGRWAGTMDLPDDRLLGKPLGAVAVDGGRVAIDIPAHDAPLRFRAALVGGELRGEAQGGGRRLPIFLHRIGPADRPPYDEQALDFTSGATRLQGSLLLPRGSGPFPAVVLVHGSSTPTRDDYRYFADLYARHGFAAFIYDKRDTGGEAFGGTASVETLAGDAVSAARMLAARHDIRGVGFWGFSQGGWLASLAAARFPFIFVVACSAPGVSFAEVTRFADDKRLEALGFGARDRRAAAVAEKSVDDFVRQGGDAAALQLMLDGAASTAWAVHTTLPRRVPGRMDRARYLRWTDLDFDPLRYWRQVRVPVLLLFGDGDRNVPARRSAALITEALRSGGNRQVTLKIYPGANHDLSPAPALENEMLGWSIRAAGLGTPRPADRLRLNRTP